MPARFLNGKAAVSFTKLRNRYRASLMLATSEKKTFRPKAYWTS